MLFQPPSLPSLDVFRTRLEQGNVSLLYDEISRRIHAPSPRPLLVVADGAPEADALIDRLRGEELPDLILATSGSTSTSPRLVGLSWRAVTASAEATLTRIGEAPWLLALPTHHVAGLQVVVRSVLLGVRPLVAVRTQQIPEMLAAAEVPVNLSVVPTQLRAILGADPNRVATILVGGAHLTADLREQSSHLPVITTYGMTETAGGCVYAGVPLPDTKIRLSKGHILLGGPFLMDGYVGEPSPLTQIGGTKYLVTDDLGTWDGEKLEVRGRADQMIISGGENISPQAVAEVLAAKFPGMHAQVLSLPDEIWGQVVCVAVEKGDVPVSIRGPQLREEVRGQLGPASAPRVVVQVDSFPLFSTGKVNLVKLRNEVLAQVGGESCWQLQ